MKLKTYIVNCLFIIFFFLIFNNAKSQTFDVFIANDHLTAPNIFEFDVYVKATSSDFMLHSVQQAFTINPAFAPTGSFTPSISIVPGTTQFTFYNPGLIQKNVSTSNSLSAFSVGVNGGFLCPGMGLISSANLPKRLCTWRIISNNGPFNCAKHNLSMIRPSLDLAPGGNVNFNFAVSKWLSMNCIPELRLTISDNGTYTNILGNTLLSQMNNLPDDKNPCTLDACDVNGSPTNTPITNTGGGENDGIICTEDNCQNGITVHLPISGSLNDNNLCTMGETCNNGVFNQGNVTPTDDGDICTIDFCNPISGIVSHTQSKDDNNPCTNDFCDITNGSVTHSPTVSGTPGASDNNLCTTDLCDGMNNTIYTAVITGPCTGPTLYLKLFIEGYYSGIGLMENATYPPIGGCLFHNFLSPIISDADYVTISLYNQLAPAPIYLNGFVESKTGILKTDGSVNVTFTNLVASSTQYYICINHRNSIETWSRLYDISSSTALNPYDFSSDKTQAFGNNMIDVGEVYGESPVWAIFSGDISDANTATVGIQDHVVESQDYGDLEKAVYYIYTGYLPEDITGDGIVESADYGLMENATYFTRVTVRP